MSTSPGDELEPENKIDEVRAFMVYCLTGGDAKRTAMACATEASRIESLAHDFRWKDKLGNRNLGTEKGQEDERAVNRLTNYVTAERLKRVFGRLVDELDRDPTFARAFCTSVDAKLHTEVFSTKNLVDLAKGIQLCHDVGYRALQDKQAQAADVIGGSTDASTQALAIYKALTTRFDNNLSVDTTAEIIKATSDVRAKVETAAAE